MKQRIFLGLAPLFVLLVAIGLYAVTLFAKLGGRIDVILRENFRSVLAAQQMKEGMERMDSGLFFSLAGEEKRGRDLYMQNLPVFAENLRTELGNITLPGEAELARRLKQAYENYSARAEVFWKTPDAEARRRMYFGELLPQFTQVIDTAREIIRINQANMMEADHQARRLAGDSTRYMILVVIAGIGCAIYFAARLQRSILQPIQALTAVSRELGQGKLDQVVPVTSNDELGQLADTFNKMAARLRAYRQAMGDQVLQARRMTEITFSAFPDPIIALSAEGHIDFTNPAANCFLVHLGQKDGLPAAIQAEVERVFKGGPDFIPTSFESVLVFRVENQEVFMLPRVIGMRDEAGQIFGAAVILQDVTRLRLLDEVKTNLVSTVSHELKTPLTSVRMGLHLLLEERIGPLNAKQTELLLAAREDSERLLQMINDLLDLAKLEAGKSTFQSRVIAPAELLRRAEAGVRSMAESQGIHLATNLESGLPEVLVDPGQIDHVFTNFISNAVKHSKPGDEIVLRASGCNGRVRFSVIDHGPGIPLEHQPHLFKRFFRVQGSERTGAGLGLAIAREIVAAQGGTIGVISKPGAGCEFHFELPAVSPTPVPPGKGANL